MTLTPSLSPLILPQGDLAAQCLEFLPELPPEAGIEGVLVLDSRLDLNGRFARDTFLLDLATGDSRQIASMPAENQGSHVVSPDRTLLAYYRVLVDASDKITGEELVVSDATGQRLESIPWEDGWLGPLGWLDNHRLVISLAGLDPDEGNGQKPSTLLLLDPFTGQRQVLKPDYTGIYRIRDAFWDGWGGTLIDPTLTRVIYPYLSDDGIYTYALWDLQQQKLLATLDAVFAGDGPFGAPMPVWSPDGSRLAVQGNVEDVNGEPAFEIFLVTRDGQVEQLTELFKYKKSGLTNFSWSPDGRYLAAWLTTYENWIPSETSDLVVVDTQTRQVIDSCISTEIHFRPIWSPDGKQLVVTERTDTADHSTVRYRVVLVDLARGFAAQIKEDVEAFGWMQSP